MNQQHYVAAAPVVAPTDVVVAVDVIETPVVETTVVEPVVETPVVEPAVVETAVVVVILDLCKIERNGEELISSGLGPEGNPTPMVCS
jgi:hypothetical protein